MKTDEYKNAWIELKHKMTKEYEFFFEMFGSDHPVVMSKKSDLKHMDKLDGTQQFQKLLDDLECD
ncbi:hypothetical protein ACN9VK_08640 [Staphylococcus caprae]|uniref:hypothetical protein n=1 Tax=Staphylococcus caprae TaxID=29380 RepID=UPI003B2118FC